MELKVCIRCLVPKNPGEDFYKRGESDQPQNTCKSCISELGRIRHQEKKSGVYVSKRNVPAPIETGTLKRCIDCGPKDLAHFRPYSNTVKGKKYFYTANHCRECEAKNEANRRALKNLFDPNSIEDLTDHYNR